MIYQARAGQVAYGYAIGMLCAEWHIPFIPGDLNNAGTFPFPVRYESVKGVSGADVLRGNGDSYAQIMADAAYAIFMKSAASFTGNFLIDDTFLMSEGVTNFEKYAMEAGVPLHPDFFVPDHV